MLSENLVMLRNLKGLTQEQVAEVVEISRQSYAKWEQGETVPDIEKCDRLQPEQHLQNSAYAKSSSCVCFLYKP